MMTQTDSGKSSSRALNVLLAEDNKADVKITLRAFSEVRLKCRLYVVNDGQEALDFIFHKDKYRDKKAFPRPDLLLLDINMPRLNGFEVLERLKDDLEYNSIPVVMLTSSRSEEDIARSYRKNAASYIPKPVNYSDFVKVIDAFITYWHDINRFPDNNDISIG